VKGVSQHLQEKYSNVLMKVLVNTAQRSISTILCYYGRKLLLPKYLNEDDQNVFTSPNIPTL